MLLVNFNVNFTVKEHKRIAEVSMPLVNLFKKLSNEVTFSSTDRTR